MSMSRYIVTFCSHFGATQFRHDYEEGMGVSVTLMPVPRYLSSSCGTCAAFETDEFVMPDNRDEIEQIVRLEDSNSKDGYTVLYSSDDER